METSTREMQAEIDRLKVEIACTPRATPTHNAMRRRTSFRI